MKRFINFEDTFKETDGLLGKVDLLTNIKINLLNKSTSNNYCAIKFTRSAILSDYDGQSLNDFEDKSLNDLTYL